MRYTKAMIPKTCPHCVADLSRLQERKPPRFVSHWKRLTLVDLFCGFGGMTIGISEAAADAKRGLHVSLAIDDDNRATEAFSQNFDNARVETARVETFMMENWMPH